MGAKFYKYEVKVGGARSECSERPLWGSGGLPPEKNLIARYPDIDL